MIRNSSNMERFRFALIRVGIRKNMTIQFDYQVHLLGSADDNFRPLSSFGRALPW